MYFCNFLVEEPCELGCDGLSYCTNFNNRPTQLFRSCSNVADEAARYDVALWQQQGTLVLPGLQLPVKNISSCSPQAWKAVACTIQIKPCQRHSHINTICRSVSHFLQPQRGQKKNWMWLIYMMLDPILLKLGILNPPLPCRSIFP